MHDDTPTPQNVVKEMPKYKCHKVVHALKILALTPNDDGSAIVQWEDESFASTCFNSEFVAKHKPEAGGYFVVYEDGYQSYSPAKAFEDGYTKIE